MTDSSSDIGAPFPARAKMEHEVARREVEAFRADLRIKLATLRDNDPAIATTWPIWQAVLKVIDGNGDG
jgi:hypothetical protein